ncbi:MAG TPA: PEP-CTERM sorting domain-containing protein [Rhizomicrobium sp.]|nr:PEP-CTERM sorting domain-containing protein [Rhizomicrobium sp.]
MRKIAGLLGAAAAVGLTAFAGPAAAAVIFTASDGTHASVSVSVINATTLSVALSDYNTPVTDAGALSGIQLLFSSAPSAVSLTEVVNPLITFTSGGTFTTSSGTPDHWGVGLNGTTLTLETVGPYAAGGQPRNLIVYAPNSPVAENGNLTNFDPYIQNTGTFDLVMSSADISALSAGRITITGANFQYSTTAGFTTGVPEPATWAMMLTGLFGMGWTLRRARKNGAAAVTA